MKYLVSFLIVLNLGGKAQYYKFEYKWPYSREQTPALTDSIAKNSGSDYMIIYGYGYVGPQHEYTMLENFNGQKGLMFDRWYHINGKVRAEGFSAQEGDRGMNKKHHGIWYYYDTTGTLYRTFDNERNKLTTYSSYGEKDQWIFDSVISMSKAFLSKYYQKEFIEKYIRLERINWPAEGNYMGFSPELPVSRPKMIAVAFNYAFNDSVSHSCVTIVYNELLKQMSVPGNTGIYYPDITVDYAQARALAIKKGFDGDMRLGPAEEKENSKKQANATTGTLSWYCYRWDTIKNTKTKVWCRETYLYINAYTAECRIEKDTYKNEKFDYGPGSPWPKRKVFPVPQGYKELMYMQNQLGITVPGSWRVVRTEDRMGGGKTLMLITGNDTLKISKVCKQGIRPIDNPVQADAYVAGTILKAFNQKTLYNWRPVVEVKNIKDKLRIDCSFYTTSITSCGSEVFYLSYSSYFSNTDLFLEALGTLRFWDMSDYH